ncbi:MAG: hypothetical protein HY934_06975 [Candidatus Firestonebacteria bacterium]|nr:hypothetical protein [Candidatus Firestonebacteria bacterium]
MDKKTSEIDCQVFNKQELLIESLIDKINKSKDNQGKSIFAKELNEKVNVLLICNDYDTGSVDCIDCHIISKLRQKTADLIEKIGEIRR